MIKIKKAISLCLALVLSLSLCGFSDADASTVQNHEVAGSKATSISYISNSDASLLAKQCISQQIEIGNHCPWNNTTKIKETVNLYDFDGQANAYLFRLETNGEPKGYIFVDANSENPRVPSFGYDGNFILDEANLQNANSRISSKQHIIYGGGLTFLEKSKNSTIKNIIANTAEKDTWETLKDSYTQALLKNKNEKAHANINNLTKNIHPQSQIIYDEDVLDNLWTNSTIYVTSDFSQDNNCAATACTNFIYYWSHVRPNPKWLLWAPNNAQKVEALLYNFLGTNITTPGTLPNNIVPGLSKYSRYCGPTIAGSDERDLRSNPLNVDWSFFTGNIHHNIPILITVALDPKYGQHVMLTVGYQNTSTGGYLRVADGWARTYSNFYQITDSGSSKVNYIIHCCYTRW